PEYRQDHQPPVDQREAVGHAVRAGYLYAGMADLAIETGSHPHGRAVKALWDDIVSRKLYLTGGVGTHQYHDEGFGDPYRLPLDSAYCEACGGIALLLLSHRMNRLTGEAKYADIVELTLLNNVLACPDLAGVNFSYRNPLASDGSRERRPWCDPACCPSNIVRIIPQIGQLAWAPGPDAVFVNQYVNSTAEMTIGNETVQLSQTTDYPWSGRVTITVDSPSSQPLALCLRIPGWAQGRPVPGDLYTAATPPPPNLTVNDEPAEFDERQDGYGILRRTWQAGDTLTLNLPLPIQRVYAHRKVEACRGRVALMRGPLVYCLEQTDHDVDLDQLAISPDTQLHASPTPGPLPGITAIRSKTPDLTAIPYYAWNNREPGKMAVWLTESN
ncbi:MAG: glycoside hydrolase family 127 protein, partial [Phycisphaeraceae bacterium]|nr:glycoside hydrolase family 127 protein [Phycisphaeraceae bacterium]